MSKIGHSQEIDDIQHQIEIYTKKIEHEKINLRLCNERNNNQQELLMKLQNKKRPEKKKRSKSKKREPLYKPPVLAKESYLDNPNLLHKEVSKKYYDLEKYRAEVNRVILENKNLKSQIEGLRKEKTGANSVLERVTRKCEDTRNNLERLREENDINVINEHGIISK